MNKSSFYNRIRNTLFLGSLSEAHVENMEAIINEYDRLAMTDQRQLAYILGTVYHETGTSMEPVEEIGKGKNRNYGKQVKYNGEPYTEPHIYYGRGHTQNTWWDNYNRLTKVNPCGWDFLNHPELLLQVEPSVWATFYAMRTGLYTGRKLSQYFNDKECDWIGARYMINGQDCAKKIELHAKMFLLAMY